LKQFMRNQTKQQGRKLLKPAVFLLAQFGITPTAVTITAVPLSVLAALLFAFGKFFWAGLVVICIGLCDTLDGELSRRTGKVSPEGAFLDSTVDRFSEGVVYAGIGWYYCLNNRLGVLVVLAALIFSYLVSYVRARAEGIGKECQVGFFERPIRVLILVAGALIPGEKVLLGALIIIALGSLTTFIHRILFVLRQVRQ